MSKDKNKGAGDRLGTSHVWAKMQMHFSWDQLGRRSVQLLEQLTPKSTMILVSQCLH